MWIITGLAAAIIFGASALWFRLHRVFLKWYEWLIGITGFLLLLFAAQNYFASIEELEPDAPRMFLLVFGLPALVLLLVSLGLPLLRYIRMLRKQGGGSTFRRPGAASPPEDAA